MTLGYPGNCLHWGELVLGGELGPGVGQGAMLLCQDPRLETSIG